MEIRAEQPSDIATIRTVNIAAFGQPGEANLVDALRGETSTLSFVAIENDKEWDTFSLAPSPLRETVLADS